jgi:hypothetical protein
MITSSRYSFMSRNDLETERRDEATAETLAYRIRTNPLDPETTARTIDMRIILPRSE